MEKLYTTEEVMEMLHVSRRTLYRYIQSGALNTVKVGKRHLISESNIKAFLDNAMTGKAKAEG